MAMSKVLARIPVEVAYGVCSGIGVTQISMTGWLFLRQPLTTMQMLCNTLIIAGAVGLNLSTKGV